MIPLPSACDGCPFQKYSTYFTPDHMVPGSEVLFIAQNPGRNEEAGEKLLQRRWQGGQAFDEIVKVQPQPLIGATGKQFEERFLPLAELERGAISTANAIRCRPQIPGLAPDDLPSITVKMRLEDSKADIVKALKHCQDAYLRIPASVKTIVTMGRHAMFALTGIQNEENEYGRKRGVIDTWRGYGVDVPNFDIRSHRTVATDRYHLLLSEYRILFTMHIAALFKGDNKKYFNATLQDFVKLRDLREGTWPSPLPEWSTTAPDTWPAYAAFDTEYIPDLSGKGHDILERWSLCDTDDRLYCIEHGDHTDGKIPIQPGSTVLAQNAIADMSHLARLVDMAQVRLEDMMLAHAVLWTGEPQGLNYIQSKYGSLNAYKHLSANEPQLYSALDAHQPMYMWQNYFIPAFKEDMLSWRVYRQKRAGLVAIIDKAQRAGSKVDTERLTLVQQILQERLEQYQKRAQELTGDPTFHLGGSKQLKKVLYG